MPETKSSKKKSDDCIELKNIKYQTMLINEGQLDLRDVATRNKLSEQREKFFNNDSISKLPKTVCCLT